MLPVFQSLVHFFLPPNFDDPKKTRQARSWFYFLEGIGILFLFATPILAMVARTPEEKLNVLIVDGGWALLTPFFLWLIRRGQFRWFKSLYTFLIYLLTLYFALRFYDNLLVTSLLFLGVMILAGQFLDSRGVLIMGGLGFLGQIFKYIALLNGWWVTAALGAQLRNDMGFSLFVIILLGTLLWKMTHNLITALESSQANEGLLGEKNKLLLDEISERQQISAALEKSEQTFRQLLDQAADAIFIVNTQGIVVSANATGCELLGYSQEELIGASIEVALTSEVFREMPQRFEEMRTGKSFIVERRLRRKDGSFVEVEISSKLLPNGLVQAIVRDITQRRQTEESLRRSEALLRVTNEIARIGGWELDLRTDELYWTDMVKEIHEVPFDYNPNLETAINFYTPEHIPLIRAAVEAATLGQAYDLELQIVTATQKCLWVRAIGRPVFVEGVVIKLQGVFQDIHMHKLAEDALRQQNARMQALHDIAISLFALRGGETAHLQTIMEHAIQLLDISFIALMLPMDDNTLITRHAVCSYKPDSVGENPQIYSRESVKTIWQVYDSQQAIVIKDYASIGGPPIQIGLDIHALAILPMVSGGVCKGILILGRTKVAQPFSPGDVQMGSLLAQLAAVALENVRLLEVAERRAKTEALLNEITRTIIDAMDTQNVFQQLCIQLVELFGADGAYLTRWDDARQMPVPITAFGGYEGIYQASMVVSGERSMTESVLHAGRVLVAEDVFNSPHISVNIAARFPTRSLMGMPLVTGNQKLGAVLISFHSYHKFSAEEIEMAEKIARQVSLALAGANMFDALRASEANLREAQQLAHLGNFEFDVASQRLVWSEEVYRIFCLDPGEPITLETYQNLMPSDDFTRLIETVQHTIEQGMPFEIEHQILLPDGQQKHIYAIIRPILDETKNMTRVFGVLQDITERRQYEQALRTSEDRLQQAVRVANIGIFDHNHLTGDIYWSPEERKIYGWGPNENVTLEGYLSQIYDDDQGEILQAVNKAYNPAGEGRYDGEHRINRRDGALRWVTIRSQTLFEGEGSHRIPVRTVGAVMDITEQKEAEDMLREREMQLAIIFDNVSDQQVLFRIEPSGSLVAQMHNRAFVEAWQKQYPTLDSNSLIGLPMEEGFAYMGIPQAHRAQQHAMVKEAIQSCMPVYYEVVFPPIATDGVGEGLGATVVMETSLIPVTDLTGRVTHVLWNGNDITERKQAEAQLLTSLQEKEILLKEIHHRVKNNLQVISSLLYLQSQKIKEPRFQDIFRESQNRVAAMALVHEQLYQSNNFAKVHFGNYIQTLSNTLFDSYGVDLFQIKLEIITDGSTLDVHQAIPCGLLVSEMVSNALKYAFPDGRRGKIEINFSTDEEGAYYLEVGDDGVGMPDASQIRPGSLGLQLIDRLVAQIGGHLTGKRLSGTTYCILFPKS